MVLCLWAFRKESLALYRSNAKLLESMRGVTLTAVLGLLTTAVGSDWPLYRADSERTGFTPEQLPRELSQQWVYQSKHPPMPAWRGSDRLSFDRVYHTVVADGILYFGSSADRKVRGGPMVPPRMVLGNARMCSLWLARGGPVVRDGIVYFGAGIWPSHGTYIYALDAETGEVIWLNDLAGAIETGQPHGGAVARSGISAHDYLVARKDYLLVPTGRAVPAVLNRHNSRYLHLHLQRYGRTGGSKLISTERYFINAGIFFDLKTGIMGKRNIGAGALIAVTPQGVFYHIKGRVYALKRVKAELSDTGWAVEDSDGCSALIVVCRTIVSSGASVATGVDCNSGELRWKLRVSGIAYGLAVARARLYISTDTATIYCFGGGRGAPSLIGPQTAETAYERNELYATSAEEIIRLTSVTKGYRLDLACGDGRLAYESARRTELKIYAIDGDPQKVHSARQALDSAGLYGTHVTVHLGDPSYSPYPQYFADLVASRRSVLKGTEVVRRDETHRLLHPYGGVVCLGRPGAMKLRVRGELRGFGSWSYQYADSANTCCSRDKVLKGPLGVLWFNSLEIDVPNRHGRPPAPLFLNGRLL